MEITSEDANFLLGAVIGVVCASIFCVEIMTSEETVTADWISVEERLPRPYESVLVIFNSVVFYDIGFWDGSRWYVERSDLRDLPVMHWMIFPEMPLSDPPEAKQ